MRALIVPRLAILHPLHHAGRGVDGARASCDDPGTPLAGARLRGLLPRAPRALALDRYHADRPARIGDEAYIALVRSGLRRTTTRKLFVLREFGNRFVWGKRPQRRTPSS